MFHSDEGCRQNARTECGTWSLLSELIPGIWSRWDNSLEAPAGDQVGTTQCWGYGGVGYNLHKYGLIHWVGSLHIQEGNTSEMRVAWRRICKNPKLYDPRRVWHVLVNPRYLLYLSLCFSCMSTCAKALSCANQPSKPVKTVTIKASNRPDSPPRMPTTCMCAKMYRANYSARRLT